MTGTTKNFLALLALFSVVGGVKIVHAQPPAAPATDSPEFDVSRTVQAALGSSKQLVQARRIVEISERRVGEISARNKPNISANGSLTRFDAPTHVAFGEGPPITVLRRLKDKLFPMLPLPLPEPGSLFIFNLCCHRRIASFYETVKTFTHQ